jgi:hypothetical protein
MLGAFFFAKPPHSGGKRHARNVIMGVTHGAAHVALAVLGAWAWAQLPFAGWPWPPSLAAAVVLYGPVAALAASHLVAWYLLIASSLGVNVNELFAAQGIEDAKAFLRLHIARDGTLTIYPVAVDRISRRWRPTPDGPPDAPWLEPKAPLGVRLAEPPIVIRP